MLPNGIRFLSFLLRQKAKKITLFSIQVDFVTVRKSSGSIKHPAKKALTCLELVCLFLNSHIIYFEGGGRAPYNNLTGRRCPKGYLFQFRINYCTLFSIFDMNKLKKPMERAPLRYQPPLKLPFSHI